LGQGDPALLDSADVPEEFDTEDHHRALAFDYVISTYEAFLDGADTFEEQEKKFEDRYSQSNDLHKEDHFLTS
jgi:kinetochore protein NDC80